MSFFIFGRPRSRTAWVANFLTSQGQFCYHEPLATTTNVLDLKRLIADGRTGVADTSLIHMPEMILHNFPRARLMVLTGAALSWKIFADQHGLPSSFIRETNEAYDRTKNLLKGKAAFIDVNMLMRNETVARGLWNYAAGEDSFEVRRWEMLRDLNIQVIPEALARRVSGAPGT